MWQACDQDAADTAGMPTLHMRAELYMHSFYARMYACNSFYARMYACNSFYARMYACNSTEHAASTAS